jgi:hypothetical protein
VLRNRTEEAGKNEAFSTFVVKDGRVKAIGAKKDAPRTIDQLKLSAHNIHLADPSCETLTWLLFCVVYV